MNRRRPHSPFPSSRLGRRKPVPTVLQEPASRRPTDWVEQERKEAAERRDAIRAWWLQENEPTTY